MSAFHTPVFSRRWWLYLEPRWGNRLDCGHHGADERMEDKILCRKAVSSLSNAGHGRKEQCGGKLFLRGEGLLPWRFAGLAALSCGLPDDEAAGSNRGSGFTLRLLLGGCATNQAH